MPQLNIRSGWQSSPPTLDNGPLSAALPSPGNVRMRPEADAQRLRNSGRSTGP